MLVRAGPAGMPAGDIVRATGAVPNTLSTHLNILSAAGLISSRRDGRSIIYNAAYERIGELLAFLVEDCCDGNPEICGPAFATLARGG